MNYDYNTKSSENIQYSGRQELRLRRKLRERKRRRKRIAIFLFIVFVFIICVIARLLNKIYDSSNVYEKTEVINSGDTVTSARESTADDDVKTVEHDYSQYSYYEPKNQERYVAYHDKHPELDPSDVTWKVNSNLDKEWYTSDIPVDGYDQYIIVNKYYTVPDGYRPPDLIDVEGQLMRKNTADAYLKMREEAKNQGLNIRAVSAYRSVEYQKGLYNRYLENDNQNSVDRYSARAGHSEHHTGMALDLFGSQDGLRNFVNTPEYPWVRDNCHKYGFIIRYQADIENITGYEDEPWHIRYVGVEISTDMKNKGIKSYEEYYEKYIKRR